MEREAINTIVVLGPTASGKTCLGVGLALAFGGEVVSADSRQVYRGLDIGSGKDLDEYVVDGVEVPYHLIDIVDLDDEFNVFEYQKRFFGVFGALRARSVVPVIVGGTGLYLEAVLKGYHMVAVPEDEALRAELAERSTEELVEMLKGLKEDLHNRSDLEDRDRLVRAIEIARHGQTYEPKPGPAIHPVILGTRWPRDVLRGRLRTRLKERLANGLVEEVEGLRARGVPWEKFHFLGLEYRYVAQFLQGGINNRNDLTQKLGAAIAQFAKRQDTWFRRMERNGTVIHWVTEADLEEARGIVLREVAAATS